MRLSSARLLVSVSAALLASGAILLGARSVSGAGDEPVPTPVAEIEDVMFTFNEGPTSVVGILREGFNLSSCDEEGWEALKGRASMTVEAGNILLGLKPPTGADDAAGLARWKAHVLDYRKDAEAARAATLKKDLAAGKAAVLSLSKRCTECHKDHRKDE